MSDPLPAPAVPVGVQPESDVMADPDALDAVALAAWERFGCGHTEDRIAAVRAAVVAALREDRVERLEKAAKALDDLAAAASKRRDALSEGRLLAKAEGVRLALSYELEAGRE